MRTFFKLILALIILLGIGYILCFDEVDYTPYFESPYYHKTKENLTQKVEDLKAVKGQVQIGFSKINITPSTAQNFSFPVEEVPLAGYGNREGKPAKGIHDSLYIKTVAIKVKDQTLFFIGADLLIIPPNIAEKAQKLLAKNTNIQREQIFYSATHTHSSMGAWSANYVGEAFAGKPNPALVDWLAVQFGKSIQLAKDDLRPGQIGHGAFEAEEWIRNRLVGNRGQKHNTFSFLIANQHQGKKAILGIYDAHATVLSGRNFEFSADYPGYWYAKLEKAGIDYPIYCAGSVGSHGPKTRGKDIDEFEKAQIFGEALADSILKYSPTVALKDTISLAALTLKIEMPPYHVRLTEGLRITPYLSKKLFPPIGEVYVQAARFDNFIWTTTPADYSGESAIVHQNELFERGFQSTITSFNGAYIGYVLPAKYYHFDKYESMVMSWFGPNMGPYLNEMIYRITDHLADLND